VPTCTGVPHPYYYSQYCDTLRGGDIRVTIRGLRKKAASQAGSVNGLARSSRTRGWGARLGHDDGCEIVRWLLAI
jgi:hypothetical protein